MKTRRLVLGLVCAVTISLATTDLYYAQDGSGLNYRTTTRAKWVKWSNVPECGVVNSDCDCKGNTTTIYAGERIPAGTLHVTNNAEELIFTMESADPWLIGGAHIYVGTELGWNGGGNIPPGQFRYGDSYDSAVSKSIEVVPLSDLDLADHDGPLYIGVHLRMVQLDEWCEEIVHHTGWAYGPIEIPGSRWGWFFCYQLLDASPAVIVGVPENTVGVCGALPAPPRVTATGTCDGGEVDVPVVFTETYTCGTFTRTWSATCGNVASGSQTITVEDTVGPTLTAPPDITVECDQADTPNECVPSVTWASAVDDCDPDPEVTFGDVVTPGACAQASTITRTWTATDDCGNSASADQIITVIDTTPPQLTAPDDVTIQCDEDSSPSNTGTGKAKDNCDPEPGVTFTDNVTGGACPQEQVITRTWTATDDCGNSTSSEQVITVVDNAKPDLTTPADVTVECDQADQLEVTGQAIATDTCSSVLTVTFGDSVEPGSCPQESVITRTWKATDECGNSASQEQVIMVVDTAAPVPDFPDGLTIECDEPTDPSNTGSGGASDACDPTPVVSMNDSLLSDGTESTLTRTWTATDACGNATTYDQVIQIVDTTPPDLTAPVDVAIECLDDDQPSSTGEATALDNCDPELGVTFSDAVAPGSCPQEGVITRTWNVADDAGNSTSVDQLIAVVDSTAPVLSIPANLTIQCDEDSQPSSTGEGTATDNCGVDLSVTFSDAVAPGECAQESMITRTWIATDECGNSTGLDQIIEIVDTSVPDLTVPVDLTTECDGAGNTGEVEPWLAGATASDTCGELTVGNDFATLSDECGATGSALVTWTAADGCHNEIQGSATVTVVDTTPPDLATPESMTVECDGAANTAELDAWLSGAGGTDQCGAVTITNDYAGLPADCGGAGSATVTWTATDACGTQSSRAATFTVVDTIAPEATCPESMTVECDGAGNVAELDAWLAGAAAIDTCGSAAIGNDYSSLSPACGVTGSAAVMWTSIDDCDNVAECSSTFAIVDTTPPVLIGPEDVSFGCGVDEVTLSDLGNATATDNCDTEPVIDLVEDEQADGDCENVFTLLRTFTATDVCGNSSTYTQTVRVGDDTPPVVDASVEEPSYKRRGYLWSPNHVLIDLDFTANPTDDCDTTEPLAWEVVAFADEDDEMDSGSGTFSPDAKFEPLRLRAERLGSTLGGDGRVYMLVATATDCAGNVGATCLTVVVPIDSKQADIDDVFAQAAEAEAVCDQFVDYVMGNRTDIPLGFFEVGEPGAPIIGNKQ